MSTPEVTMGALLQCSFGAAPGSLTVLPVNRTTAGGQPAATIMDHVPLVNIPAFGACSAPTNPAVAAATAAALGVLTPQPCIPATSAPWMPGTPTVTIGNLPALDTGCKLMCQWLGVITVTEPSQMTVTVP